MSSSKVTAQELPTKQSPSDSSSNDSDETTTATTTTSSSGDLKDALKDDISGFIGATTLHGIRYSAEGGAVRRCFWLVTVVASIAFCAYQISLSVLAYYEYGSVVSASMAFATRLDFPTVTICNNNKVLKSRALRQFPQVAPLWQRHAFAKVGAGNMSDFSEAERELLFNTLYWPLILRTQATVRSTFVFCKFGRTIFDCRDIAEKFVTTAGACFSVHSRRFISENMTLVTRKPGPQHGLELILDVQTDEYYIPNDNGVGFTVLVHDPDRYPRIEDGAIKVSPGSAVDVALTKHKYRVLSKPYRDENCVTTDYEPRDVKRRRRDYLYSQEGCMLDCYHQQFFRYCDCDIHTAMTSCTYGMAQNCSADAPEPCDCPRLCDYTEYETSVSASYYPNVGDVALAEHHRFRFTNVNDMRLNLVALRVYFGSLQVRATRQTPAMQPYDIFSNIGGLFGLFMGASMMTLLEFGDFVVVTIHHHVKKRIAKNKEKNKQSPGDVNVVSPAETGAKQAWQ